MTKETAAVPSFSFSDFASADTADMFIVVGGKPTDWAWTFAGPGHPKTIDWSNRTSREQLHEQRQIEQQRLNGKKVKLPEETLDGLRERNIDAIVARLISWTSVEIEGNAFPFSEENARQLLSDRRFDFIKQASDFLGEEQSFSQRSAKKS